MAIAIEKEEIIKSYTFTHAQILAVLGAEAGEELKSMALDEGIVCVTEMGSPITRRQYRISYPEARSLIGLVNGENFTTIDFTDSVTFYTERQTI